VARVAGVPVSRQEFEQARRRQLDQLRQVLGDQADAKLLDSPEMVGEVLDDLIARRALLIEAERRRIVTTDARLRETIASIPGLRKPDGGFDMDRYRALLGAQGLSEAGFEAQMRMDLAMQALPDSVGSSAFMPRAVIDRLVGLQEQVREVRELVLRPADFVAQVKPTDEQLRKHYEANASAFETPESAKVQYVVLGAEALASQVVLGADDVRTYYEQNKARYAAPDERRASHLLVKLEPGASDEAKKAARERAEGLAKQAREGADFAALAKANSQDPGSAAAGGDLGFFTRDTMVKPFADAAFSMKEGEIAGPVESEFGYHVIKLTGIKAGSQRGFEQVRGEIEQDLRNQQASRRFAEAADAFSNMVYEQSDSLEPAAEKFGLKIVTEDNVTRSGVDGAQGRSPLANPKLLAALFSPDAIKAKRNTDAVDVGGSTLVSARIVEHRPASRKPFDAVAEQVRARVIEQESRRLAVEAGQAKLKALREGAPAAGLGEPRPVTRAGKPTVSAAAVDALFRAPAQTLPAWVGVELGAGGYGIYQISKVTMPPEELLAQRRPQYAQQLAQLQGQQAVFDYVESLKARSKVERHPERVSAKGESR